MFGSFTECTYARLDFVLRVEKRFVDRANRSVSAVLAIRGMPTIISTGSLGCLPNIETSGVSCIIALKHLRHGLIGRTVKEMPSCVHGQHAVHGGNRRSETKLPRGRYGVVRVFLYPSIFINWYTTLFSNSAP